MAAATYMNAMHFSLFSPGENQRPRPRYFQARSLASTPDALVCCMVYLSVCHIGVAA